MVREKSELKVTAPPKKDSMRMVEGTCGHALKEELHVLNFIYYGS